MVGDAISEAEFAPFPYPLPPASGRDEPVRSRLAPLDLLSPFVLRTAGSVFRPVNFLLLSHSLSCYLTKAPSGHSGPVLTLSNAARSSPFLRSTTLAGGGCGRLGYFSAGSCF